MVDDASTDRDCGGRAREWGPGDRVDFRQIGRSRNAGANAAIGRTLVSIDADTVVPAATLKATIAVLKEGAVGGGATVDFDGRLPLWAWVMLPIVRGGMRFHRLAAGCYLFCSRDAFDASGGFDERLFAAEELAFSRALGRQGRVVILRERVTTSGRKLRSHSGWEVLRLCGALARRGTALVRSRDRLSIWYGDRRDDL